MARPGRRPVSTPPRRRSNCRPRRTPGRSSWTRRMDVSDRLYRSPDDRILAGVAGGLAEMLDVDPSIIRIVWAVVIVLTGGLSLPGHIVMALVGAQRPVGGEARH